jgi:hypothetical protein
MQCSLAGGVIGWDTSSGGVQERGLFSRRCSWALSCAAVARLFTCMPLGGTRHPPLALLRRAFQYEWRGDHTLWDALRQVPPAAAWLAGRLGGCVRPCCSGLWRSGLPSCCLVPPLHATTGRSTPKPAGSSSQTSGPLSPARTAGPPTSTGATQSPRRACPRSRCWSKTCTARMDRRVGGAAGAGPGADRAWGQTGTGAGWWTGNQPERLWSPTEGAPTPALVCRQQQGRGGACLLAHGSDTAGRQPKVGRRPCPACAPGCSAGPVVAQGAQLLPEPAAAPAPRAPTCSVVKWTNNRGVVTRTLYSPWARRQLRRMGLSPATAFACLFDLLFRPTPATLALHSDTLQARRRAAAPPHRRTRCRALARRSGAVPSRRQLLCLPPCAVARGAWLPAGSLLAHRRLPCLARRLCWTPAPSSWASRSGERGRAGQRGHFPPQLFLRLADPAAGRPAGWATRHWPTRTPLLAFGRCACLDRGHQQSRRTC